MRKESASNGASSGQDDALPSLLGQAFFARDPLTCAIELIGCELVWGGCRGRIVETEAYAASGDEACHTFLRRGAQRFVETHPAGTAYIYLNYGIHWLINVLVKGGAGAADEGFVLIRALEPLAGLPAMRKRRGPSVDDRHLCSGPGKLTQALGVPPTWHGRSLCTDAAKGFHARASGGEPVSIVADTRIGISRAADLPWRFLLAGSRHVSRAAKGGGTAVAVR
jgi:DNA-3-methyladenine glycosylase